MIRFECSCLLRVSVRFPNVGAKIHKIIETAKSPRRKKYKKIVEHPLDCYQVLIRHCLMMSLLVFIFPIFCRRCQKVVEIKIFYPFCCHSATNGTQTAVC